LSFERLAELDADVLFWQVRQKDDGTPNRAAMRLATRSPLWSRLPAVQAGQVTEVVNRPWYFPGLTSAGVVLDDVERALLAPSASPPPG
jgi:ABC-type Fe3+-hydroxamate transport system substrate-binding protein